MAIPNEIEFLEALMPGVDSTQYVCETDWKILHVGVMKKIEEEAQQITLQVQDSLHEGTAADVLRTVHGRNKPGRVGLISNYGDEDFHDTSETQIAVFTGTQAVLHGLGEIDFPTTIIILDRQSPSYGNAVDKVIARRSMSRNDFEIPTFKNIPSGIELIAFEEIS